MSEITLTIVRTFRSLVEELCVADRNVRDPAVARDVCELLHKSSAVLDDARERAFTSGRDVDDYYASGGLVEALTSILAEFSDALETVVTWLQSRNADLQKASMRFMAACSNISPHTPLDFLDNSFRDLDNVELVVSCTQSADVVLASYANSLLTIQNDEYDFIRWVVRTPTPTQAIAHLLQGYEYFQQHGAVVESTFQPILDPQEYEVAVNSRDWYEPLDPADEHTFAEVRVEYAMQLLTQFAEYQEMIVPFVDANCLRIAMFFADCNVPRLRMRGAEFIARVVAHKKFAHQFVEDDGIQLFLKHAHHELRHITMWFFSVTIYRLSCIPGAMELILALDNRMFMTFFAEAKTLLERAPPQIQRYIILFFSMAISFPKMLDTFDEHDCLQHVLSALDTSIENLNTPALTPPGLHHRPVVEAATGMIWQYLRYHLATTMQAYFNELRVAGAFPAPTDGGHSTMQLNVDFDIRNAVPASPAKPLRAESEDIIRWNRVVHHTIASEGNFPGLDTAWRPYAGLVANNGLIPCFQILMSEDNRYGYDSILYVLNILDGLCAVPDAIRKISECQFSDNATGIDACLNIVLGSSHRDPAVLEEGLTLLRSLALPPDYDPHRPAGAQQTFRRTTETDVCALQKVVVNQEALMQQHQQQVRTLIRSRNGIRGLVDLLHYRRNIQFVDSIRLITAQVLLGLTEDPDICRIFEKLRLSRILSDLVRAGPISEQALMRHQAFREYSLVLIGKLSGEAKPGIASSDAMDPVNVRLEKAAIVAQTTLSYDQRQLLGLIRDHLTHLGLDRTSSMLTDEANLPQVPRLPSSEPSGAIRLAPHYDSPPAIAATPVKTAATPIAPVKYSATKSQQAGVKRRRQNAINSEQHISMAQSSQTPALAPYATPAISESTKTSKPKRTRKSTRSTSPAPTGSVPRVTRQSAARAALLAASRSKPAEVDFRKAAWKTPSYFDTKRSSRQPTSSLRSHLNGVSTTGDLSKNAGWHSRTEKRSAAKRPNMLHDSPAMTYHHAKSLQRRPQEHTLDSIVLSFLRNQHSQCSHPVSVLPPLDLVHEHRCPVPPGQSNSVTHALETRQRAFSGRSHFADRVMSRYLHARLRYWRHFKETGTMLTACAFGRDKRTIYLSNHLGQLISFDPWKMHTEGPWDVGSVATIVTSKRVDAPFIMTCSFDPPLGIFDPDVICRLWREDQLTSPTLEVPEMYKPSFNSTITKACGFQLNPESSEPTPVIIDLSTGALTTLQNEIVIGHAGFDRPTCLFGCNDELLLACGNLWDVRTNAIVHRFDRLTRGGDGVFHPNGNEVLIDGNIWDIRTHRLLRTIPLLNKCTIQFNPMGDVLYAFQPPPPNVNFRRLNTIDQAFRIIDATDYTEIQSIHTDGTVMHHVDVDPSDQYLALIDSSYGQPPDSVCKVFEIGRTRPDEGDSDIDDGQSEDEEWQGDDDNSQSDHDRPEMVHLHDGDFDDDDDDDDDEGGFDDDYEIDFDDELDFADDTLQFGGDESDFDSEEEHHHDDDDDDDDDDYVTEENSGIEH